MKNLKKALMLMLSAGVVVIANGSYAAPTDFDAVPAQAAKALGVTRGKNIRTGIVFINGSYMNSPYKVERYGTAVRVNRRQITDEVVSWRMFLGALNLLPESASQAPKPAPEKKAVSEEAKSVDALFDEGKSTVEKPAAPAASDLDSGITITSADVKANARTKAMLKTINDYRTTIDKRLRNGQMCFFGKRYNPVFVPSRLASNFLAVLPEMMRDSSDGRALFTSLREKGYSFLSVAVCEDLVANRQDYLKLVEQRKKLNEDNELMNIIESGASR